MKIHAQLLSSHANKQRSKQHRPPPVSEVIKQYGTKTRIIFFLGTWAHGGPWEADDRLLWTITQADI